MGPVHVDFMKSSKQLSDVEQKYRAADQEIEETKGNLTRIVAEHKRQVEDLERVVSGGKSELEECKKELKRTKADAAFQLADKDAELEDLQSELKASKEKAEEQLSDIESLRMEVATKEKKFSESEERVRKAQDKTDSLQTIIDERESADMESKTMISAGHAAEIKALRDSMEQQKQSHEAAMDAMQNQMAKLGMETKAEISSREEQLQSLQANLQHEKSISEVLGKQLEDARSEIDSLNARMLELTAVSGYRDENASVPTASSRTERAGEANHHRRELSEHNSPSLTNASKKSGKQASVKTKQKQKKETVSFARTVAGSMRGLKSKVIRKSLKKGHPESTPIAQRTHSSIRQVATRD